MMPLLMNARGDTNPGGRLVTTWPASLDQLPPMMDYDIRNGHTYMYFKSKPLYPFPATQRVVSVASKTSKKEME